MGNIERAAGECIEVKHYHLHGKWTKFIIVILKQTHAHTAIFLPVLPAMSESFCDLASTHESSMDMYSLVHLRTSTS